MAAEPIASKSEGYEGDTSLEDRENVAATVSRLKALARRDIGYSQTHLDTVRRVIRSVVNVGYYDPSALDMIPLGAEALRDLTFVIRVISNNRDRSDPTPSAAVIIPAIQNWIGSDDEWIANGVGADELSNGVPILLPIEKSGAPIPIGIPNSRTGDRYGSGAVMFISATPNDATMRNELPSEGIPEAVMDPLPTAAVTSARALAALANEFGLTDFSQGARLLDEASICFSERLKNAAFFAEQLGWTSLYPGNDARGPNVEEHLPAGMLRANYMKLFEVNFSKTQINTLLGRGREVALLFVPPALHYALLVKTVCDKFDCTVIEDDQHVFTSILRQGEDSLREFEVTREATLREKRPIKFKKPDPSIEVASTSITRSKGNLTFGDYQNLAADRSCMPIGPFAEMVLLAQRLERRRLGRDDVVISREAVLYPLHQTPGGKMLVTYFDPERMVLFYSAVAPNANTYTIASEKAAFVVDDVGNQARSRRILNVGAVLGLDEKPYRIDLPCGPRRVFI